MESIIDFNLGYVPAQASFFNMKVIQHNICYPSLQVEYVDIRYPKRWFADLTPKPYIEELISWFEKIGLCSKKMERVLTSDFSTIGWISVPTGTYEQMLIHSFLAAFSIFLDDIVEKLGNRDRVNKIFEAVTKKEKGDPWVEGLKLLGEEYKKVGAPDAAWKRALKELQHWSLSAAKEAELIYSIDNGIKLSFGELIKLGSETVGIYAMGAMTECSCGFELPREIRESEKYKKLLYLAGVEWRAANDLMSVAKDIEDGHKLNLIIAHKNIFPSSSVLESHQRISLLREQAVIEYDKLAEELLETIEDTEMKARVDRFLDNMRFIVIGTSLWGLQSKRYQQRVIDDSVKIVCRISSL